MRGKNLNCGIRGGLWDESHLERMGPAVWLFGWLIHRQTRERDGVGLVLGGSPLTYAMIQGDTGYARRTLQRWMGDLRRGGYVRVRRTGHSRMVIEVLKAKKFGAKQLAFPQANFFAPNSSAPLPARNRPSSAPIVARKNAVPLRVTAAESCVCEAASAKHRQFEPERQNSIDTHGGEFPTARDQMHVQKAHAYPSQESADVVKSGNEGELGQQGCVNGAGEGGQEPQRFTFWEANGFRQSRRTLREMQVCAELRVGEGPDAGGLRRR